MKQTLKIIIISALATAAVIKAVPALAEPAPGSNAAVVKTADLDLASPAGKRALEQRLVIAAHQVCDTASSFDLQGRNAERDCRDSVLAAARARARAIIAQGGNDSISLAVK
jgi:UrcA family protein